MFRTDLLSIIRGLNAIYTAIGTCQVSYVDCLLVKSSWPHYHDKYLLLCIQCWDSWWWTVYLSETCRVLYQNKFEKQCTSLAFIIRIYHEVLSSECQTQVSDLIYFNILQISYRLDLELKTAKTYHWQQHEQQVISVYTRS